MQNELRRLTSPRRQNARRKAVNAKNAEVRAKARRQADPSPGFKALVNRLTLTQLIRVAMNSREMTTAERAYVHTRMANRSRLT